MSKVKVTLVKSSIDHSGRIKRTLKALGLTKIGSSKEFTLNPSLEGQINKVKQLLSLEKLS
ncbi:MAG: 50S ribosomal protein L30 [Chitinophagales bacterium]|nr:50S ribosomal protein L30 [Chitinophagales bacterium]